MQAGLFAPVAALQALDLPDADVHFMQGFYSAEQAQRCFQQLLSETAWQHEKLRLWGKWIDQPRLTAWYGDEHRSYTYSGLRLQPLPWTPLLERIRQDVQACTGDTYNAVLLNLYRNEQDSVAWHSDDEAELGPQPAIASLSLGATRTFKLRHKKLGISHSIMLDDGCLLRMAGLTQRCWKHAVLKERNSKGPRINLTFRHILR